MLAIASLVGVCLSANNRSKTAHLLANASLGGFLVSKPRLHALLDAKLVGLAKWLATKRDFSFFACIFRFKRFLEFRR
ncbi:hypothetical protein BZK27_07645 (plasmid) [Helicobacter pylori]|nr:hypothetical protein BZK27_07645 [Helicobacter pylori]